MREEGREVEGDVGWRQVGRQRWTMYCGRDGGTAGQRDRETDRDRQTGRQAETKRQRDRETERRRDGETETHRERPTERERATERGQPAFVTKWFMQ